MRLHLSKPRYLSLIISPTAFVALLLPTFTVNRPLRPDAGPAPTSPASGSALLRISISPRRQHRLFGANVRLAALLGYEQQHAIQNLSCQFRSNDCQVP